MNANKMLYKSKFSFSMQILFTKMQMRNVNMVHMSLFRDAIFLMQMSHVVVRMQSLSMMVPAHMFNRDANVSLQKWRCQCLVMQMPSNGYVMMQMPLLYAMSWCKCALVGMPWCKCIFIGVPWYRCTLVDMSWCRCPFWVCNDMDPRLGMQWMQMSPWEYAMMWMSVWEYAMAWMSSCRYAMNANAPLVGIPWHECFDANTIYSKIPFIFKTRLPQRLKPKYFQTQFIIPKKSSSFFDLRLLKKLVITVRNLRMGHWFGIWWSGSKDLFSQFGWTKRGGTFSRLFLKKWILWKSSILRRFIFFFWIWQFDRHQDLLW